MSETCAVCAGELEEIGALGRRVHYRCRSCGMPQSRCEEPAPTPAELDARKRETARREAVGAVLAQLEDLSIDDARAVLVEVLGQFGGPS